MKKNIIAAAGLLAASLFLAPAPASAVQIGVAAVPEAAGPIEQVQYGYGRGYGRGGYGGRGYGRGGYGGRGYGGGPRYGGRGYGRGGYGRVGPGNALGGGIGIVRGPVYNR